MEVKVEKNVEAKFLYVFVYALMLDDLDLDDGRILPECDYDIDMFVTYWSSLNAEMYSDKYKGMCLKIDIDNGNIVNWPANVGGARFRNVKVQDNGIYMLTDGNNNPLIDDIDYRYVPECLQIEEKGYGDYFEFEVEGNGHIKHWKFTEEDVKDLLDTSVVEAEEDPELMEQVY